jgi:DNA-binding Lrp family transcriptional regulator
MKPVLDQTDRAIINRLQDGLAICERPFAAAAAEIGITEEDLLSRLQSLISAGVLSRVGPLYNAARFGGELTLCAMCVPPERFEEAASIINAMPEVAHNYQRAHHFNMWFVLATETPERAEAAISAIESLTDIKVFNFPKQEEYFIGMRVEA